MRRWLSMALVFCLGVPPLAPGAGIAQEADRSGMAKYSRIMWDHLETLVQFGPRYPGSPGHRQTQELIARVGGEYADAVQKQAFSYALASGEKLDLVNWRLVFQGTGEGRPLLIGTHYDTRPMADEEADPALHDKPIPGANDGGSGTALLLGLARYLQENPPRRPVHLVFFDGEDYGAKGSGENLLGSIYYARQLETLDRNDLPYGVLVIDMVGDRDLQIFKETHSMKGGLWLVNTLYSKARKHGLDQFKSKIKYTVYDDHYPFYKMGIPAALLIDLDYPHWHTLADTLDKCSPESLMAVFRVVTESLPEF